MWREIFFFFFKDWDGGDEGKMRQTIASWGVLHFMTLIEASVVSVWPEMASV